MQVYRLITKARGALSSGGPLKGAWEKDTLHVTWDHEQFLGAGNFGKTYMGEADIDGPGTELKPVAVKVQNPAPGIETKAR